MRQMKDSIYSEYREKVADFVFDKDVVSVFDDMIRRSVPGYATVAAMTKVFAEQVAEDGAVCYDLGCSLGASAIAMRRGLEHKTGCRIIAVDNSEAMAARCRQMVEQDPSNVEIDVRCEDILDTEIENCSLCAMNFTLQFLSPENRDEIVKRIASNTRPGGMLLLSEKIRYEDKQEQDFQVKMHHKFKSLNGYSELEISQKRRALENVLLPDSTKKHFSRLSEAGYSQIYLWFKCFNFISIAAVK
ncbi:carboxy-S-adenosyl-L-methionine synthase CmoA [Sedimentisphaera cyanobacteriorum]